MASRHIPVDLNVTMGKDGKRESKDECYSLLGVFLTNALMQLSKQLGQQREKLKEKDDRSTRAKHIYYMDVQAL